MRWCFFVLGLLALSIPASGDEQPRVELELLLEMGSPPTAAQSWLERLKDLGLDNIRIRQAKPGEELEVVNTGTEKAPAYRVVGAIMANGELIMPGGRVFTIADRRALLTWISKISTSGQEEEKQPSAFGLSEKQLVTVHEALAKPVSFSTKGESSQAVLARIARGLSYPIRADADAQKGLHSEEPVLDGLKGVSQGTALAAILRPLGLVFAPEPIGAPAGRGKKAVGNGGPGVQLRFADSRTLDESWPVGWPLDKPANQVAPEMFKFLNFDFTDVALTEVLDAIQGRVHAPMLFDHNSLVRHRIDPAHILVSLPPGNSFYKGILDKVLNKSKLRCEIRMDEAEHPFVWISTIRK